MGEGSAPPTPPPGIGAFGTDGPWVHDALKSRSGFGGSLEDLGPILAVPGVMVTMV